MTIQEANMLVKGHGFFPEIAMLEHLLSDEFLSAKTKFKNADELFSVCKIDFANQQEFDSLDVALFDELISKNTDFNSWVEFLQAAFDFQSNH